MNSLQENYLICLTKKKGISVPQSPVNTVEKDKKERRHFIINGKGNPKDSDIALLHDLWDNESIIFFLKKYPLSPFMEYKIMKGYISDIIISTDKNETECSLLFSNSPSASVFEIMERGIIFSDLPSLLAYIEKEFLPDPINKEE